MSTGLGVALGLLSAVVFGVASVAQAGAVRGFGDGTDALLGFLRTAVRDGRVWLVVIAYVAGFVLHAAAILLLPLYLAQATIAMQLPVTALLGGRIETALDRRRWAAVAVVSAGLVLTTLGAGAAGSDRDGGRIAALAWVGVGVLVVASSLARRLPGAALGLLGGLGYAGSALSVRGLGLPVDPVVVVTAVAVPTYSVVAFWLYSLAMRRARVAAASAALIVVQTFIPAAVAVIWLGDAVRDGWGPVVGVGLLLAVAGAAVLGRDDAAPVAASEVATGR